MTRRLISLWFIIVLLGACNGVATTESPLPTESPISSTATLIGTLLPFPTFTPTSTLIFQSPEPASFPHANVLNDALPKENLLLAIHFYSDMVGHLDDEICYDIGVYNDDTYIVISCLPDFTYPAPTGVLDENQSKFLQRWMETFQSFDEPSMQGLLKFTGKGTLLPGYSDIVSMRALFGEIEWSAHQYVHRGGTPTVVFHAREVLSHQLNKWLDDSTILKFEVADFPDTCLGAPKPDEVCEPIVTQGFRIYFVVQDLLYEYHTDVWGYDIRSFGEPQIAPTQGAGG